MSSSTSSPRGSGGYEPPNVFAQGLRFTTVAVTLVLLFLVDLWLVGRAAAGEELSGVRSLAASVLPLVIGGYMFLFRRDLLRHVRHRGTGVAFAVGVGLGLAVMVSLELVARFSAVPIPELVVASTFALLVFSSDSLTQLVDPDEAEGPDSVLPYFYGVLAGMLAYVVFLGVPGPLSG